MYRLMQDAKKIDSTFNAKFSLDSKGHLEAGYADMIEAIHIIQTNMGITGTTAEEASSTIQGSVSSMKSAWQNMLTGLATGNTESVGNLVNNLVDSVMIASQNILPRVQEIANGITAVLPELITKINENLPTILESGVQILNTLIEGIRQNLYSDENGMGIIATSITIIETLLNGFVQMLPNIISIGGEILLGFISGITESIPDIFDTALDIVFELVEGFLDNVDIIIDTGIQLISSLIFGIIEALPKLIEKAPEIIQKLMDAIIRNFPKVVQVGGELIGKLISGITGSFWKLLEVAPQLISNIVKGLSDGWTEIKNVGKYLVEGLWDGISGMASWVGDKVKSFATNIVGNIKGALGIHSPSTILRDQVGKFMAQGIGIGFSDEMKDVTKNMQNSIPREFDVTSTVNRIDNSNQLTLDNITSAFVSAVKSLDAKIIIDKDVAGRFVITSVNNKLGEVM